MTGVWGLLALAALLWPDRLAGPFDGVPLDRQLEADRYRPRAAGAVVVRSRVSPPPRSRASSSSCCACGNCFRRRRSSRTAGACASSRRGPYVKGQTGAPHAWDLRADWRSPDPALLRDHDAADTASFAEFPAWFFNLPPPNESWPEPLDRPPAATVGMTVHGFLERAATPARCRSTPGQTASTTVTIDDVSRPWRRSNARLTAGIASRLDRRDADRRPLALGADAGTGSDVWCGADSRRSRGRRPIDAARPSVGARGFRHSLATLRCLACWLVSAVRRIARAAWSHRRGRVVVIGR